MIPAGIEGDCREAIRCLDRAMAELPAKLSEDVDEAERVLARVRDRLIELARRERRRPVALDRVNVALSLVVGVEYPLGGLHRDVVRQAREVVADILDGAG
jgi:hypothetical protein